MQQETENIKFINRKLKDVYGVDVSVSKPRFRLVWSTDQEEVRVNEAGFDIYNDEGTFLRTEYGPHRVEKYQLHPDMWVLEELCDAVAQPTLKNEEKFSYEPKWFFGVGGSNPIPIWRAVDLIVKSIMLNKDRPLDSPQTMQDNDENRMGKEKILFKDILRDASPYIPGAIHDGSAVVVPHKQFVDEKVNENG